MAALTKNKLLHVVYIQLGHTTLSWQSGTCFLSLWQQYLDICCCMINTGLLLVICFWFFIRPRRTWVHDMIHRYVFLNSNLKRLEWPQKTGGALKKKTLCEAFPRRSLLIGKKRCWRPEKNNMWTRSITGTLNRIIIGHTCAFPFDVKISAVKRVESTDFRPYMDWLKSLIMVLKIMTCWYLWSN